MLISLRFVCCALLTTALGLWPCHERQCAAQVTDASTAAANPSAEAATSRQRHFQFQYHGTICDLPAGSRVRVWLPVARSMQHQEIGTVKWQLPLEAEIREENKYGNRYLFFEFSPSEETQLPFAVDYEVTRREVNALTAATAETASDEQRALFLKPNRLVPIDGRPLDLLESVKLPDEKFAVARELYNTVEQYMAYDKSVPGYGNGDSVWACDSRTGNCTDFHSVFISLARSQKIPARFEIGFPLPPDATQGTIGGYHCWASFFVDGRGWVPVDISEADKHPELKTYYFGNLTADRMSFSTGRDIDLDPRQDSGPLNYFVYPHVEVDGAVWPSANIDLNFSFQDIETAKNRQ